MKYVLLAFLFSGCALFQRPAVQKVVRCSGEVAHACSGDVPPTILACLIAPTDPTPCLLALVETGKCVTKEALACRVRDVATAPAAMTLLSGPDVTDDGRKERQAERFFQDVGITPVGP